MTSLRNVERQAQSLSDIRAIMNSMRSLAYMETTKLGRIVPAQRAVTAHIETAAADLLAFHPDIVPQADVADQVWVVLGTERGFCGSLNQTLLQHIAGESGAPPGHSDTIIAIGRKLHAVLENAAVARQPLTYLDGAGVTEETPSVINRIIDELDTLQRNDNSLAISAIYHDSQNQLLVRELLPPFRALREGNEAHANPPIIGVAPADLLMDLSDQYLFSVLFEILYDSLLNENLHRVRHLGEAVRHLDKQTVSLAHRANALRQEQIIEEIEVLLLNI